MRFPYWRNGIYPDTHFPGAIPDTHFPDAIPDTHFPECNPSAIPAQSQTPTFQETQSQQTQSQTPTFRNPRHPLSGRGAIPDTHFPGGAIPGAIPDTHFPGVQSHRRNPRNPLSKRRNPSVRNELLSIFVDEV